MNSKKYVFSLAILLLVSLGISAQVVVPFKQRTAANTPEQKIYRLKGDFQMIGNSNLTKSPYSDDGNNTTGMVYVDIDGDPTTLNSSSATLQFPAEAGIDHSCTKIVYAGLYWMGRAHDGTSSPESFMAGATAADRYNGDSFYGYSLAITAASSGTGTDSRIATYTFTGGSSPVVFRFHSWRDRWYNYYGEVTVQVGSGPETAIAGNLTSTTTDNYTFTFSSPYTINVGAETIIVNSLRKRRTDNTVNTSYRANVTGGGKLLNKREVKFKKAGGTYTTVTANVDENNVNQILYPTTEYGMMYAAYAEVTDYVKTHGVGEYFVADMALNEGDGGGTGFFGGWSLVVIYENPKMTWRDITIFDGYAYVQGSTTISHTLDVNGFRTAKSGSVRVKMGLMAGEGDRSISGDYFEIKRNDNGNWERLFHSGNSTTNFFNSSIPANNPRNPNRLNNYGLDVAMFEVPNTDNGIIGNSQSSTSFRYGSTQDTYVIPTIVFAVDAYVPDVRGVVHSSLSSSQTNVAPGEEVEYTLQLSNASNEAITGVSMDIPIPYTAEFVSASAAWDPVMGGQTQQPVLDTPPGNLLHWQVGTLPMATDPNNPPVLATLTFKLRVTNDCNVLVTDDCLPTVALGGSIKGHGQYSQEDFSDLEFITGYTTAEGGCESVPIYGPLAININVGDHCPSAPELIDNKTLSYCENEPNIYNKLAPLYPNGTRFFDKIVHSTSDNGVVLVKPAPDATEYTAENDFPKGMSNLGTKKYYAIPFGSSTCAWDFNLIIKHCSYWVGTNSTDWNTKSNWSKNIVPASGEEVVFATAGNNNNQPAVKDLHVPANEPKVIGDLVNNSDKDLVVTPDSKLTINGKVTDTNTDKGTIVVKSTSNESGSKPTGTLIFTNPTDNQNVEAKVEFYNQGYQCKTCGYAKNSWQYFGVPVLQSAFPSTGAETVNRWDEFINSNKWVSATGDLHAFQGYEVTNSATTLPTNLYTFGGTLVTGDRTINYGSTNSVGANRELSYTSDVNFKGWNLIGNSYTGAIDIKEGLTFSGDVESSVYLFNTGTTDDWRKLGTGATQSSLLAGSYLAVPQLQAGQAGLPATIPSMHAFYVKVLGNSGNPHLAIAYDKLQKNALVNGKAWRSENSENERPYLVIDVMGSKSADRLWLFEQAGTTDGYDNGWDGEKRMETRVVQMYAQGNNGQPYQVATNATVSGTQIGFTAEQDDTYRLAFAVSPSIVAEGLYLYDKQTKVSTPIRPGEEYAFRATKGDNGTRFAILKGEQPTDHSSQTSGVGVYGKKGTGIDIDNSTNEDCMVQVYDLSGRLVLKQSVKSHSRVTLTGSSSLAQGVYVVNAQNTVVKEVKRVTVE